jgi:glucosamine-6-phosphate deaminase
MHFVWCETQSELDSIAADKVIDVLARAPDAVLALPTGQTPLGMYANLRARFSAGEVSFADARLFNLDEYVGLAPSHPLSYQHFLQTHLIGQVNTRTEYVRLLRGDVTNVAEECRNYDAAISHVGGLDLAILGLGTNGHIAFNEPGADWSSATHVVELSSETRAVHLFQQGGRQPIPAHGLTMGVATIRAAREILLLVAGEGKRSALEALCRGRPDPRWPVTSLLDHPALTVVSESRLRRAEACPRQNDLVSRRRAAAQSGQFDSFDRVSGRRGKPERE